MNEELAINDEEFLKAKELAIEIAGTKSTENQPQFVIIMGGIGSGKTTYRRQNYSGYVNFDAGEISNRVKKEFGENNPKIESLIILTCGITLETAINERKNIVIEITGDNYEVLSTLITKMKEIGYELTVLPVYCEPKEAYERHLKAVKEDDDYLSSYFTEESTLYFFYQILGLGKMPSMNKE